MKSDRPSAEGSKDHSRAGSTHTGATVVTNNLTLSHPKEFSGGCITWSVISLSYDGLDYAGYLNSLVMASINSAKKRCWCILLDGYENLHLVNLV